MTSRRRGGHLFIGGWLLLTACGGAAPLAKEVPEQSSRSLLATDRFGWVSSERSTRDLPSAIALGGKTSGRVLIYLEFPEPDRARKLVRAELWLSLSARPAEPVDVELSRSDAAGAKLERWSEQPHARYPRLAAKLGAHAPRERLDVSELVSAPDKAGEPLRLLLRAEPSAAEPVLLETGAFGGSAPRLELYWE